MRRRQWPWTKEKKVVAVDFAPKEKKAEASGSNFLDIVGGRNGGRKTRWGDGRVGRSGGCGADQRRGTALTTAFWHGGQCRMSTWPCAVDVENTRTRDAVRQKAN